MTTPSRSAELVALANATDAHGQLDLTVFQAQRLILQHQSVDGLDAESLVRDLVSSPAYQDERGRAQVKPLLDAIGSGLNTLEGKRFADALDAANIGETRFERTVESITDGATATAASIGRGLDRIDDGISDSLASAKRWADGNVQDRGNSYLERAAANMATSTVGQAQDNYGALKGASQAGLNVLGETVDLAKFAHRFSTDTDFRNLVIGAVGVYAAQTARDPSKPVDDVSNAARKAWNEWEAGLEKAQGEGKEREYVGEAKGAVGAELLMAVVPASKIVKLAKLTRAIDAPDTGHTPDLPDETGQTPRQRNRAAIAEFTGELRESQAQGGVEGQAADLAFNGLAGVKRSQAELRELIADTRAAGNLDGLLASGALSARELGYLARHDVTMFDGQVPFEQALGKWVGHQRLADVSDPKVGEIGEAIVAHRLSRADYSDLTPIQNTSGHGIDMVGIHPETGRWEVFEVKASVQGKAAAQRGDPEVITADRLELASSAKVFWKAPNLWEEQAAPAARRIQREAVDPDTGKLDVDYRWARVNLSRDQTTGAITSDNAHFEVWKSPAHRKEDRRFEREERQQNALPSQDRGASVGSIDDGLRITGDLRTPGHPGHAAYTRALDSVLRMEFGAGIARSANSERLAAAVAETVQRETLQLQRVELGENGQVFAVERGPYPEFKERRAAIDTTQALASTVEQSSAQWLKARSPHYAPDAPVMERATLHADALASMSPTDRALFSRIREGSPAGVSDDHVAQAMLLGKQKGVTDPDKLKGVTMVGDTLWVMGHTPGFRAAVDVGAAAPPMQQTAEQSRTFDQQREQQLAQEQTIENERSRGQALTRQMG